MPTAAPEFIAYTSAGAAFGAAAASGIKAGFDVEAEILQAWEMFPDIKDRVYFVDLPSGKVVYPGSRLIAHGIANWLRSSSEIRELIELYSFERKSSCCIPMADKKRCILLYTAENPDSLWNRIMPRDQSVAFVLDHEIGHAVIPDATYEVNPNLAECMADAYAVIRHFQRYGADSKAIDGLVALRATRFVFSDAGNNRGLVHFTSPVVEQLLARRNDVEWSKLTPEETTGLARRFGLMYAPHPVLLERMDGQFKECHTGPDSVSSGNYSGLTKLIEMLEHVTFPAYLKLGAQALEFFGREADALPGGREARLRIADKAKLQENMDDILSGIGDAERNVLKPRRPAPVIANQP